MKTILLFTLLAASLDAGNASAADPRRPSLRDSLSRTPAAELPARAAELVKAAQDGDRGALTTEVVRAGLGINPGLAATLAGTIAKAVPEMASVAAGTAAGGQPRYAAQIAQAAVRAAPAEAGRVVAAVCRAVPAQYKHIALAVARVAPDAVREILDGVASAIPELEPGLAAALARYGSRAPSIAAILDASRAAPPARTAGSGSSSTGISGALPPAPGPLTAPPPVPPSGTPPNHPPSNAGPVPRGHRNYASP